MREWVEYVLYRLAMGASLYSPLRLAYWFALRVADLHFFFDRRGREAVMSNLRVVLKGHSDEMIRNEARWTFRNFGKYLAEFFRFSRLDRAFVEKYVLVEGREHLDEALDAGRGVIVISAHFGNWELGGGVGVVMGYDISSVALDLPNRRVNELLNRHRMSRGVKIVSAGRFMRGCYRVLKEGGIVALLADRDTTGHGIRVPFFGVSTVLPQGPARLSLRTGAPIVPIFMIRRANDGWLMMIEPPIWPRERRRDISEEDLREMMMRYLPVMERYIRRHPSQWAMFHPLWGDACGRA